MRAKINRNKKIIFVIIGLMLIIVAALLLVLTKKNSEGMEYIESIIEQPLEKTLEDKAIENPIDFKKLKLVNEDIYAWIEIPNLEISYPILQHPTDDSYYLKRSYDRSFSYYGAVFSQAKYNATDFSDSCTVLYGHRMKDGTMFAGLSKYMRSDFMQEYDKFYIYTPDKVLEYEIFAAIPFDNRNILYTWDCSDKNDYWSLIHTILNTRSMDANIKTDYDINLYDRIVILSTCYPGDSSNRYLVIGKLM